jgi:hypothetical protein
MTTARQEVFGGYADDELRAAFALVKNQDNWKLPVDATVPADADRDAIDAAVIYFTGGPAAFVKVRSGWRVVAAGYYACIGS